MRPGQDVSTLIVEAAVLFAASAVVPLGLRLLEEPAAGGAPDPLAAVARKAARAGALCAAVALVLPHGPIALLFAVPWVAAASLVGLLGLRSLAARPHRTVAGVAADLARMNLPVGAAWFAAYAGDLAVMQFHGLQCLLTAVHFHYAGFGACAVTALVGRSLDADGAGRTARTLYVVGAVGMMAGIPLLAAGITWSRALEHAAGWDVAASAALLGALLLRRATRPGPPAARPLFALAGAATALSSALAFDFARSGFERLGAHALASMVRYHGLVNALGFVGCGLAAFALDARARRDGA